VRILPIALALVLPASFSFAQTAKPQPDAQSKAQTAPTMTDEEKTIYAVGLSIAKSLSRLDLSPQEVQIVTRAIMDSAAGKPAVDLAEWGPKIQPLAQARASHVAGRQKAAATAYLDKAAAEPGAVKTESGLVYRDVTPGTGTEFDSSYKRNEPASFQLNGVIPCWTEGMQKMKVGGKAVLVCPSNLAYGDQGNSDIPGGATLIFEVELLDVTAAQ
jgi:FKBP-type peptidyl-prolyl cis-trans isomerase FkpA